MMNYQQESINPVYALPGTNYPSGTDSSQQQPIPPITPNPEGQMMSEPILGTPQMVYPASLPMAEGAAMQGSVPVAIASSVGVSGPASVNGPMSAQGYVPISAPGYSPVPIQGYAGDVVPAPVPGYSPAPTQGYVMEYTPVPTQRYASAPMQMQQYPASTMNSGMYQDPNLPQQQSPIPESTQSPSSVQSFAKGTVNTLKTIGTSVGKAYGQFWKGVNKTAHTMTTKALEKAKKKQKTDFPQSDRFYIHRNPPCPPMNYFDDTFVSMFEVALSLKMQNAFKQKDISY
ncbi:hypothetical protein WA171_005920 [Blastocystis sp. BT1]